MFGTRLHIGQTFQLIDAYAVTNAIPVHPLQFYTSTERQRILNSLLFSQIDMFDVV